jgi:hypothetical protein
VAAVTAAKRDSTEMLAFDGGAGHYCRNAIAYQGHLSFTRVQHIEMDRSSRRLEPSLQADDQKMLSSFFPP